MFQTCEDPTGVLITVTLPVCHVKDFVRSVVRGRSGGEELRGEEQPGARPRDDQTHDAQAARNEQLQLASRW